MGKSGEGKKVTRQYDQSSLVDLLTAVWVKFPEMRLCQLIENVLFTPLPDERCMHTIGADKFYVADEDLRRHLIEFSKLHEIG